MTRGRNIACLIGIAFLAGGCSETTVRGPGGQKLTLVKPSGVSLDRGEAETVTVHLRRDNMRNETVRISISQLPHGVEAVDAPRSTNADSVNVILRASDKADLVQNHQALVTAEGPDGMRATEYIQITVREKS